MYLRVIRILTNTYKCYSYVYNNIMCVDVIRYELIPIGINQYIYVFMCVVYRFLHTYMPVMN